MIKASRKQNIFIQYLAWQFFDVPKEILKAWKNYLLFNLSFFSIPLLVKTFFSHWRRYRWSYGRGFDLGRYVEVIFSNLISRILGAIVRSFLLVIGLSAQVLVFFAGFIVFVSWFILPVFLIASLIFGFRILF